MTTKTSFFNKGIYKSTLKRYSWGSVLYFILLFMITGLAMLLSIQQMESYHEGYKRVSILLRSDYLTVPMLLSIIVPTVVGLLIFRFIHSKKASVFTHSLPVTRVANYVSSVLAGFTLMAVPVILNTLILMAMSLTGCSEYFTVNDCMVWMLSNLFSLFVMFSCVCFASSITGNSFAMIVLNVLVHAFLLVISAGLSLIASVYLYGFPNDDSVLGYLAENCFPVKIMSIAAQIGYGNSIKINDVIIFVVAALVLYVASAILYKKRNLETAGDVAGFGFLNPLFKYLITFIAALAAFSMLYGVADENSVVSWIIVAIVSAVIYFAVEMLLKKTLRVWSGIKGFAAFAAAFAAMICFFAFTTFFGYETRIPKSDTIKRVAIYDYYEDDVPFVEDKEATAITLELHKQLLELKGSNEHDGYYIHIMYELENGKTVHRRYETTMEKQEEILETAYLNDAFKKISEPIFGKIDSFITLDIYNIDEPISIEGDSKIKSLVECMKKDIKVLEREYLYNDEWNFNIQVEYVLGKETDYFQYDINMNFKNTINWLKENGYWDAIKIEDEAPVYIVKNDNIPFMDFWDMEIGIDHENAIILDGEKREAFYDFLNTTLKGRIEDEEKYIAYKLTNPDEMLFKYVTQLTKEQVDELTK